MTGEEIAYPDEPFMEELRDVDLFNSVIAAPPDPTGVAVRGDQLPWECGEDPALGQRHNDMSQTLQTHLVRQRSKDSPVHAPAVESAVISRQRHESTPDVATVIFNYVTDKTHAEAFGAPSLWGSGLPKDERFGKYGHVGTRSCQSVLPGTTRHRDRDVVVFAKSEEVKIGVAFPVQPSTNRAPPRSRLTKPSRLLRSSSPVPQPASDATGVAPQLRGMGGAKTSAMAEGTALTNRRGRELDEGMGSGSGGDRTQPGDRRDGYGQRLGPPTEVRVPAAPLRKKPLIRKRLILDVNAVEHNCHGNACDDDVRESPRLDVTVHGDSAAFSALPADGVSAMAGSVSPVAEAAEIQSVTGDVAETRCESRRVAAARRNAARVRDDPTLNQAMACIHRERWLEAMLDELHSLSEHGVFELCELPAGCGPLPAKWVLKIKRGAQGEIELFKARYVANGFEQVNGVDLFETLAPVGRYATLRALLSICVVWGLETTHIDIKCAFLNGVLQQHVYIVQPPMFHDGTRHVWKLNKPWIEASCTRVARGTSCTIV